LMALYTMRSDLLFCEQLDYNLLFRWFLDLEVDEVSFDHTCAFS
jgi:transposase